jgi:hypothetical protein
MVAYTVETKIGPQAGQWEELIHTACLTVLVRPESAIKSITLTHRCNQMTSDEIQAVMDLAKRLAADYGLSLESDTDLVHMTMRFSKPEETAGSEAPKDTSFGGLLGVLWQCTGLARRRRV